MKRSSLVSSLLIGTSAVMLSFGVTAPSAMAARKGQLCAAGDVGKTAKDDKSGASLTCAADGSRNRWQAGAGASGASGAATKSGSSSASKSGSTPTPTRASATATKSKSSGSSGGSTGSGTGAGISQGRFCGKADEGKRQTDIKGRRVVCATDAGGRLRWQAA